MTARTRKRLGELLVEAGVVNEQQIQQALDRQRKTGGRLGQTLVELGHVSEDQVADVLARHYNVPRIDLDKVRVERQVLELIPDELMERYQVFPLEIVNGALRPAMVDPLDIRAIDDLRRIVGKAIEPRIVTAGELQRAWERHDDIQTTARDVLARFGREYVEEETPMIEDVSDSAGVQLVNLILEHAVKDRASDIHIEPGETVTRVRQRVDGRLRHVDELPRHIGNDVISRIKVMAQLDITNRRTPQDGRLRVEIRNKIVDLRVSTLPTIYGEKAVLRLLSTASDVIAVENLAFQPENLEAVRKMLSHKEGMILVTGPTGSGKTTTLYSFLNELNTPDVNIVTIEDPVEIRVSGINQVGINPRAGLTFAGALRSVLRQDPDVVMVGEMRDTETAEIAVRAALTGHIVLSTLHTNSAVATVGRLLDMGIAPYLVAGTVIGIMAQRLVRKLCEECKRPVRQLAPEEERFLGSRAYNGQLYEAVGCPVCNGIGFAGRLAIEEVLLMHRELKRLVRDAAPEEELLDAAQRAGFVSLRESGIRRVLAGETTVREVMAVVHRAVEDDLPDVASVSHKHFGEEATVH